MRTRRLIAGGFIAATVLGGSAAVAATAAASTAPAAVYVHSSKVAPDTYFHSLNLPKVYMHG